LYKRLDKWQKVVANIDETSSIWTEFNIELTHMIIQISATSWDKNAREFLGK